MPCGTEWLPCAAITQFSTTRAGGLPRPRHTPPSVMSRVERTCMAIASLPLSGFDPLPESWSEPRLRYDLPHMDVVSAQQHSSARSPAANMYPDIPTRESHDLHRCGPLRKNPSPQTAHSSSAALAFSVGTFAYPIDALQPGVICKNADACHGQVRSRIGMCVLDLQPKSGYKAHI